MNREVTDADVLRILQRPRKPAKGCPMRGPADPQDVAADAVRDTGTQQQVEGYEPWDRSTIGRFS